MTASWYVSRDGKERHGPFAWDKLKEWADFGRLQPTDMVLKEGEGAWNKAADVEGLIRTLPTATALPSATPLPPAPGAQPSASSYTTSAPTATGMPCATAFTFLVGVILLVGGGIGTYRFWEMDTSVEVEPTLVFGREIGGGRVNNLSLMQTQHDGIIISLGASGIGAIFILISAVLSRLGSPIVNDRRVSLRRGTASADDAGLDAGGRL